MSVVIRLSKTGKRGTRIFRIVALSKRSKRNAAALEILGFVTFAPKNMAKEIQEIKINRQRISYWQSIGAKLTPAVAKLLT